MWIYSRNSKGNMRKNRTHKKQAAFYGSFSFSGMINCIYEHFQRIKSAVFCFRSRMQYTSGRITNRAFQACKIPLKFPGKTAMQNAFTLFRNDVKLSFVKTTKFIVQFSQSFSFQCRNDFLRFRSGKNSVFTPFLTLFQGLRN